MKVAFLVNDLALSGGMGVIVEHAHQLRERHGFDSRLVLVRDLDAPIWEHRRLQGVPVQTLAEAAAEPWDVAIATWWETTFSLFELRAERYAYFIQSLEDRFYRRETGERFAAALTQDLPVDFVTEARWIADTLEELRPGARVFVVRNGIDKGAFPLPEELDVELRRPLRVLIEGYPQVWFKHVDHAARIAAAMREHKQVTIVTPDASALAGDVTADRVIGPLSQAEMSEVYAGTDVVLKLSSVEGMFGPPLEGFHRGATCVVTPVTGHDEYVEHGWNGVVVDWDDARGTTRALDLLARDRRYLHFLRTNAVETARSWPDWRQSGDFMAAALRRIRALPPPDPYAPGRRLAADIRAWSDFHRWIEHERTEAIREMGPIWRVREHPVYVRLRRFRHRPLGRALTWPLRVLLRRPYRRLMRR